MRRLFLVFCVVAIIHGDEGEWRVVKTSQGSVRGRKDLLGLYVFKNIPYATVPKGPLKFTAPLPPPMWLQPLETSEKEIVCPQAVSEFIHLEDKLMQEECLIANVYVPVTDNKNIPVLVYVHGGAFELGYGDMLYPKQFVKDHNIIVVTFNYRLGVHGFLCLGTDTAPGNAGMKDQVALLQWVNRNIASFGGNPKDITIAGYSAGSMSVDLLMLSKSAQGLFHKVIQESGSSLASATVQINPLEDAKIRARQLRFPDAEDIYSLEKFYIKTPLELLFGSTFFDRTNISLPFGPCVERKSSSAFLSDSPVNIIKKGNYKKVPILMGFSNMEGLLWLGKFDFWKNKMNEKFSEFIPADLHFENDDQKEEVSRAVKIFYFGDQLISDQTVLSFINYLSDVYFTYPTLREVKLLAESGHEQIYLYEYSFVDDQTPVVPHTQVRGATHCAQTDAIFDGVDLLNGTDERILSKEYIEMKRVMRELWSNFVKYGKPVPEGSSLPAWLSAGADGSPHMSLGQKIELRGSLLESRARFWDGIYQQHYREPMPPPKPPHIEL